MSVKITKNKRTGTYKVEFGNMSQGKILALFNATQRYQSSIGQDNATALVNALSSDEELRELLPLSARV